MIISTENYYKRIRYSCTALQLAAHAPVRSPSKLRMINVTHEILFAERATDGLLSLYTPTS